MLAVVVAVVVAMVVAGVFAMVVTMPARSTVRWRTGRGYPVGIQPVGIQPVGIHPVDNTVELFDDPIEATGSVPLRGPLVRRPFVGRPCEMHSARHARQHHHTPCHRQPLQCLFHRLSPWSCEKMSVLR
jgi:hypothetical protein